MENIVIRENKGYFISNGKVYTFPLNNPDKIKVANISLSLIDSERKYKLFRTCDTGYEQRMLSHLTSILGGYSTKKPIGIGEELGIRFIVYEKFFYLPMLEKKETVIHIYNKYTWMKYINQDYIREFFRNYKVVFEEKGYGDYNFPVWITTLYRDTLGEKFELAGGVYDALPAVKIGKNVSIIDIDWTMFDGCGYKEAVEKKDIFYRKLSKKNVELVFILKITGWGLTDSMLNEHNTFEKDDGFLSTHPYVSVYPIISLEELLGIKRKWQENDKNLIERAVF